MRRTRGVTPEVRKFLSTIGGKGGRARARSQSKNALDAMARRAAFSRWMRERFDADTFEELGLPGWEIVDKGLRELVDGNVDANVDGIEALAVAELAPRLRYLGVPVPKTAIAISHPREKLYRVMENQHGGMAHERFLACLQRVDSFCDALSSSRTLSRKPVRRDRAWCR